MKQMLMKKERLRNVRRSMEGVKKKKERRTWRRDRRQRGAKVDERRRRRMDAMKLIKNITKRRTERWR